MLTAENDEIKERLERNAVLQWNIMKENDTDTLITANLHLRRNPAGLLFNLDPSPQTPVPGPLREKFGDRIECHIKGGKTYICTLQNLTYSDANVFELEAGIRRGQDTSLLRSAKINLIVVGMEHIIISCSCS